MRLLRLALVSLALYLLSPTLLGHGYLNGGLLALGRSVRIGERWQAPLVDQAAAQPAEVLLQKATSVLPDNYSAGRSLGLALALQGHEDEALAIWKGSRIAAGFAQYGEQARQAGRYQEALVWFRRAYQLEPGSAAYAYYTGLMHERLQQWRAAEAVYRAALDTAAFHDLGQSDLYYRLGLLYQWRLAPPEPEAAETAYLAAIQWSDFRASQDKADTYYRLGELYDNQGHEPGRYLAYYQQAVALDPDHYWAHLRLGQALYETTGDVRAAVSEMERALALWPAESSRKWPYRLLGDLYRESGAIQEAIVAYQEAQRWDPADEYVQAALRELTP